MPGGRLTHQDRQRIAEGLAQGIRYTEIARQLGRPTSTISREVARNGGPKGYRPDRAQRSTGKRARRRKPAAAAPKPGSVDTHGRDLPAVRAMEERYAELLVQTGFSRMMARVLVSLMTSDAQGSTASELVQRLRVSAGSVSKAIKPLERIGLVKRVRDPRQRRERYLLDNEIAVHSWITNAQSMVVWSREARQAADILGPSTAAGARMLDASQFLDLAHHDMLRTVARWQQILRHRRGQE